MSARPEELECYRSRLYRLARARVRSREDAEDLTQEALLKALLALPGYRGECALASWLETVLRRLLVDHYRRRREGLPLAPELDPPEEREWARPGVAAERTVVIAAVRAVLPELPPTQRAVIELCDLWGLTHPEAAAVLRIPLGTLKKRQWLARQKLRGLLASHLFGKD
ncbi:MAG TPA: sigma-70 family RNA polymerase sigma factor [Armatimonadota bacterium]|nr:sigma-70 family RNA polymerase sigma factor [Armatimonadota bacterium]